MKVHELKTYPMFFSAVKSDLKKFEVRKNDRRFEVGHELLLREFDPSTRNGYTGNISHQKITYILSGGQYGIEGEYVVLGIEKV